MSELTCLVVDDEPAIRTFLRSLLQAERFNCLEAESALQAIRIIHKLQGRIDLIVSDIRMPGDINGLDLAHYVRNAFPNLPVILISGYADEECVRRAAGFDFIRKPFDLEAILKAVRTAVDKGSHGSSGSERG